MSDEVIEAGAEALGWALVGQLRNDDAARFVLAAAVPLLLAPLRELHAPFTVDGVTYCQHCAGDEDRDYNAPYPCPTVRELDRIEARYSGEGEA